jgi:hypothetical protein
MTTVTTTRFENVFDRAPERQSHAGEGRLRSRLAGVPVTHNYKPPSPVHYLKDEWVTYQLE